MEQIILNEINRIHEIMGVSKKNILLEGKGGLISELLGDLVSRGVGAFERGAIRGLQRTSKEVFEERLSTIINRLESGLPISPTERSFLTGVIRNVAPDIPVRLFNDFIGPALDEISRGIPVLGRENFLRALRNPNYSDKDVVQRVGKTLKLGTKDSLIPDMTLDDLMALRKHFKPENADEAIPIPKKRKEGGVTPDDATPEPQPNPDDVTPPPVDDVTPPPVDDVTPPPVDDVTPNVADDLSPEYIRRTRENIPSLDAAYVARMSRNYRGFGSSLRKIRQYIIDTFTSVQDLQNECLQLMNDLNRLDPPDRVDALKRIDDLVDRIASKEIKLISDIEMWINVNIRERGDFATANKLTALPKWQKALALLSEKELKEWLEKYGTLWNRRGRMWTQFFKIITPGQWIGKNLGRQGENWFIRVFKKWKDILWSSDEYKELRSYLATGQTKNWEALKDYARKRGVVKAGLSVGKEFLYNYAALTLVIAEAEWVRDLLAALLSGSSLKRYQWIVDNKNNLDKLGINIDLNELLGTEDTKGVSRVLHLLSGAINIISDQTIRIYEEGKNMGFKMPGVILNLVDYYQSLKIDTVQEAQKAISELDERIQRGQQELQQQTENAEEQIQKIDYAATELGFKTWALASGKDFKGFSDLTKRGYTNDNKIYYQQISGKDGYVEYNPPITSVQQLLTSIPALSANKSTIVKNPDGSFTETLKVSPDAPHITPEIAGDYVIDIKPDGKAYYITVKGQPIQPFEVKQDTTNTQ